MLLMLLILMIGRLGFVSFFVLVSMMVDLWNNGCLDRLFVFCVGFVLFNFVWEIVVLEIISLFICFFSIFLMMFLRLLLEIFGVIFRRMGIFWLMVLVFLFCVVIIVDSRLVSEEWVCRFCRLGVFGDEMLMVK